MVEYVTPASCGVVYPIHTAINSVELNTSNCYALVDPEFSTLHARLLVATPALVSTRYFKIPVGCETVAGATPTMYVKVYTDATCTTHEGDHSFDLGVCTQGKYLITCERQTL